MYVRSVIMKLKTSVICFFIVMFHQDSGMIWVLIVFLKLI